MLTELRLREIKCKKILIKIEKTPKKVFFRKVATLEWMKQELAVPLVENGLFFDCAYCSFFYL